MINLTLRKVGNRTCRCININPEYFRVGKLIDNDLIKLFETGDGASDIGIADDEYVDIVREDEDEYEPDDEDDDTEI